MNQVPAYTFELQASLTLLRGVDNSWVKLVGGAAWVYNASTWRATGSANRTERLTKLLAIPINAVVDISLTLISIYDEIIEINLVNPATQNYENTGQFVATRFVKGGPSTQVIRVRFNTYANTNQSITICTRSKTVSPIDVTFNGIAVTQLRGATRIVNPGNFKSLNLDMERSTEYWGSSMSLSGSIELVGDDWRWVREILYSEPALLVWLKLTVNDGVTNFEVPPVILDTSNLDATGDGTSYKCGLQLLKEAEWARFLSYIDERIDLDIPVDVEGFPVIDGQPLSSSIAFSEFGKIITMQQKFYGFAAAVQNVSVPADAIYYIGFGSKTNFNDNFEASKGVSTTETLVTVSGKLHYLSGRVKLSFNSNGMPVEIQTGGVWSPLTSAVEKSIVYDLGSYGFDYGITSYSVRVRNTTGAAKNFSITADIDNNYLDIVAKVIYDFRAVGYRPLLALKYYISRIVGDYDNLVAPVFDTRWAANKVIGNAETAATGLYNPPSPAGKDYAGFYDTVTIRGPAPGTLYTGGTANWKLILNGDNLTCIGTVRSNSLMIRATNEIYNRYIPIALINISITFAAGSPTGVDIVKVYGNRFLRRELLGSFIPVVGAVNNLQVNATRIYDGISIEVEGANFDVNIDSMSFASVFAAEDNAGQHALTYVCNGLNSKRTTAYDPEGVTLAVSVSTVIKSLRNLFGLALWPEVDLVTGYVRIHVDKVDKVFLNDLSTIQLRLQKFQVNPDQNLIYDMITVGGEYSEEFDFYGDASSTKSNYTSQYITTKKLLDQSIPAALNTPLIVNGELGNDDLIILDMLSISNNISTVATRYRLDSGLTIAGSVSPLQPNWLYSEGRIMRNNLLTIFAGGSRFYRLMFGKRSSNVSVNYSGDAYGPIADADPIIASSKLKVFNIYGTTEIDLSELPIIIADIHKTFDLIIDEEISKVFIKKLSYNFASGKMAVTMWPTSGALQFANPTFELTPLKNFQKVLL